MLTELPVLRLALAGFTAEQQLQLSHILADAPSVGTVWELGALDDADAWWVDSSRIELLDDGMLRVAARSSSARSILLNLAEIDRPIAFSVPLAQKIDPLYRFDIDSTDSMHAVLARFEAWLRPLAAQFCLASHIIEHETALGSGIYHVKAEGKLLAVVDLQGEVGVLSTAGPIDFDDAMWIHQVASAQDIPRDFVRTSLSQLMWQFAVRTSRDVLPRHYRTEQLHFRRPPRLPHRLLRDSHLLLMRELACAAGSFEDLQQRTGLGVTQLARDLAALYLVGSITSNPKRAAAGLHAARPSGEPDSTRGMQHSVPPSQSRLDGARRAPGGRRLSPDLTVPAPMTRE